MKEKLYRIVFRADTPAGRRFDLVLIVVILLNVALVMLDSVGGIREKFHGSMLFAEWVLTVVFTVEYLVRVAIVKSKRAYLFSFFGVVDFLAVAPAYVGLLVEGSAGFAVFRLLRLFRIFRILKLIRFMSESSYIMESLRNSRFKIYVFLFGVLNIAVVFGSLMYLVEGPENGFTSIPKSVYWAIVTLSTVGYGDISPNTVVGQLITTMIILLGYGIIAVPTGIVSAEMARKSAGANTGAAMKFCPDCGLKGGHASDARFCRLCGKALALSTVRKREDAQPAGNA